MANSFTIEVLPGNVIDDMVGKIREAAAQPGAAEAVARWRAEHGRELWHRRGHDFAVVGRALMYLHDGPDGMLVTPSLWGCCRWPPQPMLRAAATRRPGTRRGRASDGRGRARLREPTAIGRPGRTT